MQNDIYQIKRTVLTGLPHGEDLLSEIEKIVAHRNIFLAVFSLIGAVSSATFGYYNQGSQEYEKICREGAFEIVSCSGNVSLKDGSPMVHAHILFGDVQGKTFGGHLMSPTRIFAAEMCLQEIEGERLKREFDKTTGLYLWEKNRW